MSMLRNGFNVLIGAQWGSEGKGHNAHYLGETEKPSVCISNHMSNAGHTFLVDEGEGHRTPRIAFHLPVCGLVNPNATIMLGPGTAITEKMWYDELDDMRMFDPHTRMMIHPRAFVILPEHSVREKQVLQRISSTTKGCGAALSAKVLRDRGAVMAKDAIFLEPWVVSEERFNEVIHNALNLNQKVLAEAAQGFDLSINHGMEYPKTTSRDISVAQVYNDCGVPPSVQSNVIACARVYPIRVGNVPMSDPNDETAGSSGPFYWDQRELTWEELAARSRNPDLKPEITTVTQKVRRVFTWSGAQWAKFCKYNDPTFVFLNFVNYLNHPEIYGLEDLDTLVQSTELTTLSNFCMMGRSYKAPRLDSKRVPIGALGTGPHHTIDLTEGCGPEVVGAYGLYL